MKHGDGRSYVLTVLLKTQAFWDMTPWRLVNTEIFVELPASIFIGIGLFALPRL